MHIYMCIYTCVYIHILYNVTAASEAYLDSHADFYWSTDYYTTTDKAAMNTSLPIYKTVDSTVQSVVVADGEIPVSSTWVFVVLDLPLYTAFILKVDQNNMIVGAVCSL